MLDRPDANAIASGQPAIEITTTRLRLRRRVPDDAIELFEAFSDLETMQWWSRPVFSTIADLREDFVQRESDNWRAWSITHQGRDSAIGFVAAGEKRQGVSEVAYLLNPKEMGQGVAHEAMTGLIGLLFKEGQRRIFADTDPDNTQSINLLRRLGFTLEGRLRGEWCTHIGVRDSLIFGMLAKEWAL